ncbi:MAG: hypothetical protein PUC12_14960 [Clostridiales bacterium]|nr:hypothetical protein [Clostridiales bacterium]
MRNSQWETGYPDMPSAFHNAVEECVEEQMQKKSNEKGWNISRKLVPVAICLFLVGGTVTAAKLPSFHNFLSELGKNEEYAKKLVSSDIIAEEKQGELVTEQNGEQEKQVIDDGKADVLDEKPVLNITDSYVDGTTIMIWAEAKEASGMDGFGFSDHIYVNGVDCIKDYMVENPVDSGQFECKITVMGDIPENDDGTLEITTKLYDIDGQKKAFSFTIPATGMNHTVSASAQKVDLKNGYVELREATVSPSAVKLTLHYRFEGEESEKWLKRYVDYGWVFEDADGNRLFDEECCRTSSYSNPCVLANSASQDIEIEMMTFNSASKSIKMIPYSKEKNAEGKGIPGTEELHEEYAVTFSLQ